MYLGYKKATILKDASLSDAVDIRDADIISLEIPTINNTNLTFQGAASRSGDYQDIKKVDGNDFAITATTGGFSVINLSEISGYGWIKIKASAAQTTATVVFKVILKKTG